MLVTDIRANGATLEIEATDPDTGLCHIIALAGPQLAQLTAALALIVAGEPAAPADTAIFAALPPYPPEITTPFQRALYAELADVAAVQRAEAALRAVPHTATGWRNHWALRAAIRAAGFTPVQEINILAAWQRYSGL